MHQPTTTSGLEQQARAIESKRNLLAYLRSAPQRLTLESYLCLTRILSQAGWHHDERDWRKGEEHLPTLEAAAVELERQIAAERDRILRQTVGAYAS